MKAPTSREDAAYGESSRASDARQLGSSLLAMDPAALDAAPAELEPEPQQRETWAPQSGIAPSRAIGPQQAPGLRGSTALSDPALRDGSAPRDGSALRDTSMPRPLELGLLEDDLPSAPALPFFVVAVGASAGGFEALQELFRHVSPESGLSFIVLQHTAADREGMLAQLLSRQSALLSSRQTALRVLEVEDGQSPQPNCIHVVPAQRVVTLEHGRFRCADRDCARVLLPFNALLTSLAEEQADQAVAIILSGTGSDGTHGARVLKEAGGLVLAQEPASARFDGMPNSVIQSGSVDFVDTPAHLVERLEQYAHKAVERLASSSGDPARERDAFDEILRLLRQHSRVHFSMYKAPLMLRRIQRRAGLVGEDSLSGYVRSLKSRPQEVEQLARELLVGVTQFFRDPAAWAYLEDTILPQVLAQGGERGTLRLWVAGCATGEEAYTLAMLLEEQLQKLRRPINYRLFATDVRRDSLRYARAGVYPAAACASIPEPLRERYFEARGEQRVARRSLRDAITFAPHDLLTEPPFTQLNLVLCRNLLVYLDDEAQHHVLGRLRGSLKEGGILFLGGSESVGEGSPHFRPINARAGMFLARGSASGTHSIWPSLREPTADSPAGSLSPPRNGARSSESLYEAVVQRYAPPGVAVDANFELLQVFGRVTDFVSLPPGRVTTSLLKMVPRSLAALLSTAGRKVLSQGGELTISDVRVPTAAGEQLFSVRICPVEDVPGVALGLLIFFEAPPSALSLPLAPGSDLDGVVRQRMRELEDELLVARENINSAVQDLEASNEELQHTNQELTGSNEELQGTNQELQSVNQELYTVNAEYQEKLAELEETNADLENLLRVVDAGVLYLDERLNIRRFNDSATRVLPLRHEDLGRPLSEIAVLADCRSLAADALEVFHTGQRKLITALGHDGAWWSIGLRPARQRCTDCAGGVIVTLQEVSELKRAIAELSRLTHAHEIAEAVSGTGHAVLDLNNEVVHFSENARRLLGLSEVQPTLDDALGLFQLVPGASRERTLRDLAEQRGPFTTERTVQVPPASAARLRLSVHARLEPSGAELVFALFQRLDMPGGQASRD